MENFKNEVWRNVPTYEGLYEASNMGRIRSVTNSNYQGGGKILSSKSKQYVVVRLFRKGIFKAFRAHGIIAEIFIPNPENKPQINHINGIKTDNRVENLEWVTQDENAQHAYNTGLLKNQFDLALYQRGKLPHNAKMIFDTLIGIYYDKIADAAASRNLNKSTLTCRLNGQKKNTTPFIAC